ncbi:MAG: VanZ family protein [Methylophilaceae bacterium]
MNQKLYSYMLRAMPLIFFGLCLLTTVMTLMPAGNIPSAFTFWDKAQHTLSFVLLTLTGSLAYPKKTSFIYLGLFLYGAIIEIMQNTLTTTRTGDVLDWMADAIGIVIGLCLYFILKRFINSGDFINDSRI